MTNVHTVTTWSTPGIQEERFSSLMSIQNEIQIPMTEHNSSAHKTVRFVSGDFLKSGQVVLQNLLSTEFVDQLQVVDCFRNTIFANLSRNIVGSTVCFVVGASAANAAVMEGSGSAMVGC